MSPKSFRSHPKPKRQEKRYASRNTGHRHWYQLAAWKDDSTGIRHLVFVRDCYLCQDCKRRGIFKPVKEHTTRDDADNQGHADHIKPHTGNWDLFIDINNVETKCGTCHRRKTARDDGGFGNEIKTQQAQA